MQKKLVTVKHQIGLRARIATIFIDKANEFKSTVYIRINERAVNGKSLLGVLSLGITGDTTFELVVDGIDETEALDALSELIETDFKDY